MLKRELPATLPTFTNLCGNSSTTIIQSIYGLNYTIYCGLDVVGYDAHGEDQISLEGCIERCTAWPSSGFVYAFGYQDCYCKNSEISVGTLSTPASNQKPDVTAGIANLSQLQVSIQQTLCPYPNLSTQSSQNGMQFKILCGTDVTGSDFGPWISEMPTRQTSPYTYGIHVDNFTECIRMCAHSHPLCRGVGFAPIGIGYVNCILRNTTRISGGAYTYPVQAAVLIDLPEISKQKCLRGATISSANAKSFVTFCNDFRPNANISLSHELKLEDCIMNCATYETVGGPPCVGVMFDDGFEGGWENCYLKSDIGQGQTISNYTLAVLTSLAANVSEAVMLPKPENPRNKAWISEPVISGVSLVLIVLALMLWKYPTTRCWTRKDVKEEAASAPLMELI